MFMLEEILFKFAQARECKPGVLFQQYLRLLGNWAPNVGGNEKSSAGFQRYSTTDSTFYKFIVQANDKILLEYSFDRDLNSFDSFCHNTAVS